MGAAKSVLTADFLLCSPNQVSVKNPESQKWDLKPTTPGTDLGICFLLKKDLPTLGVCLVFWPIQRKLFISLPSLASFTRRAPAPQLLNKNMQQGQSFFLSEQQFLRQILYNVQMNAVKLEQK